MESQLRGLKYTETFTHKFVGPLYDISETDWNKICYIIVISAMMLSIYNLSKNKYFQECLLKYNKKEYTLLEFGISVLQFN
jgi:hypothetical protein